MSSHPISYGAYCVVTLDCYTRRVLRVGIYSASASGLTGDLSNETMLDGPKVENEPSYAAAHKKLIQVLQFPNYRWLYDMLSERDRS